MLQHNSNVIQSLGKGLAAAAAAAMLSFGSVQAPALASEFDVVNTSTPSLNYLIDDAGVLNKTTKKSVNDRLYKLEVQASHDLLALLSFTAWP